MALCVRYMSKDIKEKIKQLGFFLVIINSDYHNSFHYLIRCFDCIAAQPQVVNSWLECVRFTVANWSRFIGPVHHLIIFILNLFRVDAITLFLSFAYFDSFGHIICHTIYPTKVTLSLYSYIHQIPIKLSSLKK